jgi:aminoglycoside phosphotransferase (APT) family kinase protein
MARSVELISWESFRERLNEEGIWTLVHGDYHPAN